MRRSLESRDLIPWIPEDAPGVGLLFVRGEASSRSRVAVVGGRAADPYGLSCAHRVARDATDLGQVVVSGGAEGCDAAAHLGAMESGGQTIVVLAGGHDHPYPAAHGPLFDRVVDLGGAVVSALWPTTPPAPWRFLARNRVVAALCRVCVVVRARARSGALSTARAAQKMGRPVLAVPGDVGEGWSEGTHLLLERGALPMIGSASLARALGLTGGRRWPVQHRGAADPWFRIAATVPVDHQGEDGAVARALASNGSLDPPALVRQTGLALHQVCAALLDLEIEGLAQAVDGDRFRWTGPVTGASQ
ncbi:MAG: DNA-protecting protein DprA [Myxococcota bacterium]|nr:DNA-protecting protein DprA [Myxococcota bacterium]